MHEVLLLSVLITAYLQADLRKVPLTGVRCLRAQWSPSEGTLGSPQRASWASSGGSGGWGWAPGLPCLSLAGLAGPGCPPDDSHCLCLSGEGGSVRWGTSAGECVGRAARAG